MNKLTDTFRLSNGKEIPCIGFGSWRASEGIEAFESVKYALSAGYRHVDTAAVYGNEASVGRAILESGTPRADIFVTTKLWNTERGYDTTLRAFDASLKRLNLDYIDLYLIHWPATKVDGDRINAETWHAFEKLHDDGLIRSLGLSNFLVHHLRPLLDVVRIKPTVNQIEFHPGLMQAETVDFCKSQGILVEAWGPLGSGRLLNNVQLSEIASRYGVSVAQLCIRWCLQHGVLPLPKSVNPARIDENANVFGFTISDADMRVLDDFPDVGSSGQHPDTVPF